MSSEVAAVIIGRNEGDRLAKCLISVQASTKHIVYVDSGSTDGSDQLAERLGASILRLDRRQPFTAARARNEGFTLLRKVIPDVGFVQFIDGDCELDKDWLETAIRFVRDRSNIAVVCGRRRERNPSASIYNRLCDIEWDTPVGETSACGGDSLVRTEAFEAVSGFRASLIAGEEPEMCYRLRKIGWKIWRLDADMTRHDAAMFRFRQWWARCVRSGYGTAELSWMYWNSPTVIWKRQLASSIFWGALLPAMILIGAAINPITIFFLLIYPLQVCRIAIGRGASSSNSWFYALFVSLAKLPQFQGALMFCWRKLRSKETELIEYK